MSQIANVSFQYGTANGEAAFRGKASPNITTTASEDGNVVGTAVLTDTAHLTGGSIPGGTITFTLTDPNGNLVTLPAEDASMMVSGNGDYTTPTGITAALVGTYHWTASYGGDTNNNPASEPDPTPSGPTSR